jgi:NADPH:quinone reductase-like Zn-dependent oxidoreductase
MPWHVQQLSRHAAGCWADWVIVKEEFLAYAPASLKLDTACGAVPLASLTAFTVR